LLHTFAEQWSPEMQSASELQLPRHAVPLQTYSPQGLVARAGQAPAPLHAAANVAVLPTHDGARHCVVLAGYVHAVRSVPLQVPPQMLLSVAHAVREPCGVPVTGEHVPTLPATSQASHSPVQAPLQHTPSTQSPDVHEFPVAQALPFPIFGTQMLPLHQLPAEQSASAAQVVLHAVAPQTYGAQFFVTAAGQVGPLPVQFCAFVCTPLVQVAERQLAVTGENPSVGQFGLEPVQVSATSQPPAIGLQTTPALPAACVHVPLWHLSVVQMRPSSVHPVPFGCLPSAQVALTPSQWSAASHSPFCARHTVVLGSGEQVPSLPAMLHAWQSVPPPAQALLQQ
jgi:hypothetical protein